MSDIFRVFLSVDIDDKALLSQVKTIQSKLDTDAAKMKLVEEENIHFTWRFFGDTSSDRIEDIHSEMSKLKWKPFSIQIQGVGAFPKVQRPRVIWIGVNDGADEMRQLKEKCDALLSNVGYKIEGRFTPHATIARVRYVRDREKFISNLETLQSIVVGTMVVNSIRMTKSTLTPAGPIYEMLWEILFE